MVKESYFVFDIFYKVLVVLFYVFMIFDNDVPVKTFCPDETQYNITTIVWEGIFTILHSCP